MRHKPFTAQMLLSRGNRDSVVRLCLSTKTSPCSCPRDNAVTFCGLASSRTWVMALGWTMGLNAGSSVPEGGCSFTFII